MKGKLKTRMSFIGGMAFVTLILASISNPALARNMDDYIFNLQKAYPQIIPKWKSIVPTKYKTVPWISNFEGPTGVVSLVTISGQPFFLGSVCKPHDCGLNNVYFLLSMDGKAAYGMLASRSLKLGTYMGTPNNEAKRFMLYLAEKGEIESSDPYLRPVSEVIAKGIKSSAQTPDPIPPLNKLSQICENHPNLCIE